MKYTVNVEVAVYESDGDMDDVLRSKLSASSTSLEQATEFGKELRETVETIFATRTRRKNVHSIAEAVANGPAGDPRHREYTEPKCFVGGDCPAFREQPIKA